MNRDDAIKKIQKCLRLAKSANANEAATALRQAQKLMDEFDVDQVALDAAEAAEAFSGSGAKDRPARWEARLARVIGDVFACDIIFAPAWNRLKFEVEGRWAFIGVGSHAEIASYAFDVLRRQAAKDRSAYIRGALKRCGPKAKTARADQFTEGWVIAVWHLAKALARTPAADAAVAAYTALHYPQTHSLVPRQRKANAASLRDRMNGFEEGQKAQLHHGVASPAAPAQLGVAQ